MPRTARASVGGLWYHALNRGNRRQAVFHKPGDYDDLVEAMTDARALLTGMRRAFLVGAGSTKRSTKTWETNLDKLGRPATSEPA